MCVCVCVCECVHVSMCVSLCACIQVSAENLCLCGEESSLKGKGVVIRAGAEATLGGLRMNSTTGFGAQCPSVHAGAGRSGAQGEHH